MSHGADGLKNRAIGGRQGASSDDDLVVEMELLTEQAEQLAPIIKGLCVAAKSKLRELEREGDRGRWGGWLALDRSSTADALWDSIQALAGPPVEVTGGPAS